MDERLSTENLGESKQHIPEKKNEVHKVEMFLGELLAARYGTEMGWVLSLLACHWLVGWLFGLIVGWLVDGCWFYVHIPECLEYKWLCSVSYGNEVFSREHTDGSKELICIAVPPPFAQQIGQVTHFLYLLILAFKHCVSNAVISF